MYGGVVFGERLKNVLEQLCNSSPIRLGCWITDPLFLLPACLGPDSHTVAAEMLSLKDSLRERAQKVHVVLRDPAFWDALQDMVDHDTELPQYLQREIFMEWYNTAVESMFVEVCMWCARAHGCFLDMKRG